MRATTAGFRAAVAGWLREERATKELTLQLLEAVHGGIIAGRSYAGARGEDDVSNAAFTAAGSVVLADQPDRPDDWDDSETPLCGCLVETLEQLKQERPTALLQGNSAITFGLATLIRYGDTPSNSSWARAAANGIEDYYKSRGWR